MAESTGQIDKLIEQKVDQKINKFARDITEQIKQFLKDNGDYEGDYLYQAEGFELNNSNYIPIEYSYHKLYGTFLANIKGGLELTIKDKMVARETKELLEKIALLS